MESASQPLFGNQPYHWRGDRATFLSFNPAFVSLMGAKNVGTSTNPKGLTDTQMALMEQMVNSITYPPNPEQTIERIYSGKLGNVDLDDGEGAQRGMKLYHTFPFPGGVLAGRSCVQCHSLPDGSNNRLTLVDALGGTGNQPIESAANRFLIAREGMLETKAFGLSIVRTSQFGLLHNGHSLVPNMSPPDFVALSTNWFIFLVFGPAFPGAKGPQIIDLIDFVRQLDTGIAPVVGAVETINTKNKTEPGVGWFLDMVEQQARLAYCDVIAYLRKQSGESGFFFDVNMATAAYRDIHGNQVLTRSGLLALLTNTDDVLVIQAVPVGSGRRVASLKGIAPIYRGRAPNNLTLEPMTPNTAWQDVPKLTKNWKAGTAAHDFTWDGKFPSGKPVPEPNSMKTLRIYQQALINQAPKFGLTSMHHEAPRRFRVAGNNIRPGARLRFWIPRRVGPRIPITQARRYEEITVNLFPTSKKTTDGRRIWESQAETDPLFTYMLMLGGPDAPGVDEALNGKVAEPPPKNVFDPLTWNRHKIQVLNEDGTSGSGNTYQQITIR